MDAVVALPALTQEGRLPAGAHAATLADVEEFVTKAPHRAVRELIFSALQIHLQLLQAVVPHGRLWLDGGFVTHKPEAPKDADLTIVLTTAAVAALTPADHDQLGQLITLQNVASNVFNGPRIQPMGGLIDSFLVVESNVAGMAFWSAFWSAVKDAAGNTVGGATKGFLEVTW